MMEQHRLDEFDLGTPSINKVIKEKAIKIFGKEIIDGIDFDKLEKDIFSTIYEKIQDKKRKKQYAQFFTHTELIYFLADKIPINTDDKILDPACGAGAFLAHLKNKLQVNLDNLYGIDIDNNAMEICKINLLDTHDDFDTNLIIGNTLLNSSLEDFFPDVHRQGGFDVVIGNPPFKNMRKNIDYIEDESLYRDVLSGVANSASLMIAKGYDFLKEGGHLGFVLPKSVFRVRSFKSLRRFLVRNTRILHLYDLGHYFKDVRGDQVLLVFQKKKLELQEMKEHQIQVYIHKKGLDFDNPYTYEISQRTFLDYEYFPVFYHNDIFKLEHKFKQVENNFETLSEGNIFRGLDISMNSGQIGKEKSEGYLIIYRGDSISRFGIKYPLFINPENLQEISSGRIERLYENKIILQNIFSKEGGIFATLSTNEELNIDTVTNIIVDESHLKYSLGVINSIIANFYIIFLVFLHSNFTMHSDRTYIGKIPIVIPNIQKRKEVEKIVDILSGIEDKFSKKFHEHYNKLNELLFDIYSFTVDEKKRIKELINEVMSRKYNGR